MLVFNKDLGEQLELIHLRDLDDGSVRCRAATAVQSRIRVNFPARLQVVRIALARPADPELDGPGLGFWFWPSASAWALRVVASMAVLSLLGSVVKLINRMAATTASDWSGGLVAVFGAAIALGAFQAALALTMLRRAHRCEPTKPWHACGLPLAAVAEALLVAFGWLAAVHCADYGQPDRGFMCWVEPPDHKADWAKHTHLHEDAGVWDFETGLVDVVLISVLRSLLPLPLLCRAHSEPGWRVARLAGASAGARGRCKVPCLI